MTWRVCGRTGNFVASLPGTLTITTIDNNTYPCEDALMPVGPDVATMTVSLPKPLRSFVAERVAAGGFGSVSDYIRELIRRDQRDAARAAFERTLADASLGLSKLAHVPPEAWQELQASVARGEDLLMSARFEETIELMKTGILLTREKLRREFPKATDAEIERRLAQWLHERSDKSLGDGPGRPVSAERLRRILGT